MLIGCIVIIVFAALIWTDSCEGSRGSGGGLGWIAVAGPATGLGQAAAGAGDARAASTVVAVGRVIGVGRSAAAAAPGVAS